MDAATKKQIIEDYAITPGDTGSPDVQIALLSKRISHLTEHLKQHKGDHHSRRGLMLLVGQRRRLLNYVAKQDVEHYRALIARLGLRRSSAPALRQGAAVVAAPFCARSTGTLGPDGPGAPSQLNHHPLHLARARSVLGSGLREEPHRQPVGLDRRPIPDVSEEGRARVRTT